MLQSHQIEVVEAVEAHLIVCYPPRCTIASLCVETTQSTLVCHFVFRGLSLIVTVTASAIEIKAMESTVYLFSITKS